ncbi:LysE family translocator [Thaumasiovibrio subtropicus]|uniref:LysE family translocator n=1 Tax=Thaumasiovibrio subtropicus TaxID=1891207 RepID=UPI000B364281|nr:LysE family translocator [Thaumasiovibrio subtropicus]
MNTLYLSMMAFVLVGAATPGPVNIVATATGAHYGFVRTLPHIIGASVAYAAVVLSCGVAMMLLESWLPNVVSLLKPLGSLFLLYVALKIATTANEVTAHQSAPAPHWIQGALMQLLNPKAWIVASAGISLYVIEQPSQWLQVGLFTLISLVLCLVGISLWAIAGSFIRSWLSTPRRQMGFNLMMSSLLVAAVASMWLGGDTLI